MKKSKLWTHALRDIFPVILIVGLVACHEEMSPLDSGVLTYSLQNGGYTNRQLTAAQLQELSLWLRKHSDDWERCFATPPPFSIFGISLKHLNGKSSSVRLLKYKNSSRTLEARYLDGSNMNDQPCAFLTVTEQDINALRTLLPLENLVEPEFDRRHQ